jgi:predicted enzyme related to lactoylglutathione lyase
MLKNVRTISVRVSDQDRAVDFYVNTLGFEKVKDIPMGPDSRWIEVKPAGAETTLVLSNEPASTEPGGFTGYIFDSANIQETYEALNARGVHFTAPPSSQPWGNWAQFADPDGNEFGVWAPPVEG